MASSICSNVALDSSLVSKPSFWRVLLISLASWTALRNGFSGYFALPTIRARRRARGPVGREIVKVCFVTLALRVHGCRQQWDYLLLQA